MHQEIEKFLKESMKGNKDPLNVRIPPELHQFLIEKAQKEGVEMPILIRTSLAMAVLPEMLESYLKAEMRQWISQNCESGLEFHLQRKREKLSTVTMLAKYASVEINKFLEKMLEAECECLNKINDKIFEETKPENLDESNVKTITKERVIKTKKE